MKTRFAALAVLLLALVAPVGAQLAPANPSECVTSYDAATDYFPVKMSVDYAQGLEIEYHNHYKVVRVTEPYQAAPAEADIEYVLLLCGTPAPEGYEDARVIEIPSGTLITMSTTYLPHLKALGLLENLIGVDGFDYIYNEDVRAKIEAGELIAIGSGGGLDVESTLAAAPSLIMSYTSGFPEYDSHPVLEEAGLPVVLNGDWTEASLLGRAEWLKFIAAFYNQEAAANAVFADIVAEYDAAKALVADIPAEERLTVLWNAFSPYTESWTIPGQATWAGELLRDAGLNLVLADEAPAESVQLSYEVVYEAGLQADVWVINAFAVPTLSAFLAADERNGDFAAFQNGRVFNVEARLTPLGGNDFYESGVVNPQLVLRDLIAIAYPDRLPDHELVYFNPLGE